MPLNDDPFAVWNDPFAKNDPFAPWNDPIKRYDPFAAWNDPFGQGNHQEDVERYKRENGYD